MSRVLIAGCGDVGSALGQRLAERGHQVVGMRRQVEKLPGCIHGVAADLNEPESLKALPSEVDVLVYSAAADDSSEGAYSRAYVEGLENVLEALSVAPLDRVLFTSSTSVYAQDDGSWVNEDSPTRPTGFSGRTMLEAEALGARLARGRGACFTAVRFGGIYGPGRTRLLDRVRNGAGCVENDSWTNRIHRDDCAGVLAHLLALPEPASLCLAVDCEPAPQCAVMDWIARRIGCAPPPRLDAHGRRRGANKRCSNSRLLESGYRFQYPSFREGYAAMLAETPRGDGWISTHRR